MRSHEAEALMLLQMPLQFVITLLQVQGPLAL